MYFVSPALAQAAKLKLNQVQWQLQCQLQVGTVGTVTALQGQGRKAAAGACSNAILHKGSRAQPMSMRPRGQPGPPTMTQQSSSSSSRAHDHAPQEGGEEVYGWKLIESRNWTSDQWWQFYEEYGFPKINPRIPGMPCRAQIWIRARPVPWPCPSLPVPCQIFPCPGPVPL